MKLAYITPLLLILFVAIITSGCTTTEVPQPARQDQLILVVPAELLQPVDPLRTIEPRKEQK